MAAPLRIAVVGAGAFGRNHLRVLRDLELAGLPVSRPNAEAPSGSSKTSQSRTGAKPEQPSLSVQLSAVVDAHPETRAQAAALYNIPAFATVAEMLAANLAIDAATVAVPTLHHAEVASALLAADIDVLIEKPLTSTLAEADALAHLASIRGRVLAAGHLERFNPSVTAALQQLSTPMFYEAHRLSVFTPRSLDVDVVLDLMIHDLDILLTMAQSPVVEVRAVGLPILSRKVDIASARLEFTSGAVANLTASRVSTEQVRKLRLFQPGQYLSLDYARQELLTVNVDPTLTSAQPSAAPHPSRGLSFEKLDLPRAEPLRLELQDFLQAVAHRTPPRVTAVAAREALALALDINAAIASHTSRAGLATPFAAP